MSNPVTWWEIQVPDLEAAKAFYSGLFGWTFKLWMEGYEAVHVGDTMIGGLARTEGDPAGRHINVVFNLDPGPDTLESALEKVVQLGGEVRQERAHIGGDMGWYASVADPTGLRFDLWTGRDKA
jgi:predicted enzyme related to lactoylglutathione lyase